MDMEDRNMPSPVPCNAQPESRTLDCAKNKDCVPKQVCQFHFVKLHPYVNPYVAKVETLVKKLKQDRESIDQARQEKLMYCNQWEFSRRHFYTPCYYRDWNWNRERLISLQLSLDKLTFANKSSRGRAIRPSSVVKEIDNHSLHFGLLHTSKQLGEERKILRKIKEAERMPEDTSARDYGSKINELRNRLYGWMRTTPEEKEQIFSEIVKLERAKAVAEEYTITSAALNGKMWHSLGSKEDILQKIETIGDQLDEERAEQLKNQKTSRLRKKHDDAVANELKELEKKLTLNGQLKTEATEWLSSWKLDCAEKNASYGCYVELMSNARELAERKELPTLKKLSSGAVEQFMFKWINEKAFRDEYQMRTVDSLNKRGLTADGRTRNCDGKPVFIKDLTINISKLLNKALHEL